MTELKFRVAPYISSGCGVFFLLNELSVYFGFVYAVSKSSNLDFHSVAPAKLEEIVQCRAEVAPAVEATLAVPCHPASMLVGP